MTDRLKGYVFCWLAGVTTLQLVSPGSVDLETFLGGMGIPMRVLEIVNHDEGEWAEIRMDGVLYAVLLTPRPSGPFVLTDRKRAIAEQLADKLYAGATKVPQIRFAA